MSVGESRQQSGSRVERRKADRTATILAAGLSVLFVLYIPLLIAAEFLLSRPCGVRPPGHECSTWALGWGDAACDGMLLVGLIAALAYGVTATERGEAGTRRTRIPIQAVVILTCSLLAGVAFSALPLL